MEVSDFGVIWRRFPEYLQIKFFFFFEKSNSVTFLPSDSPNLIQKIRKIIRPVPEKTALPTNQQTKYQIKVPDFRLIWRPFHEYLQINNIFQKCGSVTFLPL